MDNKASLSDLITLTGQNIDKKDQLINIKLYEISETFGLDIKSSKRNLRINNLSK